MLELLFGRYSGLFIFLAIVLGMFLLAVLAQKQREKKSGLGRPSKPKEPPVPPVKSFEEEFLKKTYAYTITLPQGFKWEPERAEALMQHMLTEFDKITFRILAEHDRIVWQVLDMRLLFQADVITRAIRSVYPEAEIEVSDYIHPEFREPFYRNVLLYSQPLDFTASMLLASDLKKFDPLTSVVQVMSGLRPGERVIYMLHLTFPITDEQRQAALKRITKSVTELPLPTSLTWEGLGAGVGRTLWTLGKRAPKYIPEQQKLFEDRLRYHILHNGYLITQIDTLSEEDLGSRLMNLVSGVSQFASDFSGLFPLDDAELEIVRVESPEQERKTSAVGLIGAWLEGTDDRHLKARSVLSTKELAALWHLPHEDLSAREVLWMPSGRAPVPAVMATNVEGISLGKNVYAGAETPVRMLDSDRKTHINIVGKTGVGKSTFMHNLIHQDIVYGKGVGVIDPHGKLVTDILRHSIPDHRIDDVVLIDIANENNPPPLNPMVVPGKQFAAAAGQISAILDKVYDIKAPRAEDSMAAAFSTLEGEKHLTVRDVTKLFTDIEYRHRFLNRTDDIVAEEFWTGFENQSPSVQQTLSYPVVYRIRHFYRNKALYPMTCHPEALDLAQFFREGKIVLISLGVDESRVPPADQQLLGAMLVSQLQMAAMASASPDNRPPFFLYIDEVQKFVTTSLETVLEEARKHGLHLTIANQYLGQLKGKILESVIGTVGATVVFQIGLNDAKLLAPYFQPEFSALDLVNLPLYNTAVKMRHDTITQPAFSMQTLEPPGSDADIDREKMIRQRSIDRYTPYTRKQVLDWLRKRYPKQLYGTPPPSETPDPDDWVVPS